MFGMGVGELLVVLVIVLLVFGPGRLPEMMGNLGRRCVSSRRGCTSRPRSRRRPTTPLPNPGEKADARALVGPRAPPSRLGWTHLASVACWPLPLVPGF